MRRKKEKGEKGKKEERRRKKRENAAICLLDDRWAYPETYYKYDDRDPGCAGVFFD
mgnify:CR=1 FL=1